MRISDWSSDVCSSDLKSKRQSKSKAYLPLYLSLILLWLWFVSLLPSKEASVLLCSLLSFCLLGFAFLLATAELTSVLDRKSVVSGKSVSVRVDLGGRRIIKKTKRNNIARTHDS